jgi:hypothetical protein
MAKCANLSPKWVIGAYSSFVARVLFGKPVDLLSERVLYFG